jgi:hypothetical protein
MTSRPAARDKAELPCRLTEEGFCRWIGQAEPGDVVEYHRSQLSVDRTREASTLGDTLRRELGRVADRALQLAAEDRLLLVQRRLGEGAFSYLAIKAAGRSRPASARVDMRCAGPKRPDALGPSRMPMASRFGPIASGIPVGPYPTILQAAR